MERQKEEALKKEIVDKHSPKKSTDKLGKGGAGGQGDTDSESRFSNMQIESNALGKFQGQRMQDIMEVPPNADSRRFNECDIIGDFERDEKGNVIALDQNGKGGANVDKNSKFKDG